MPGLRRMLRAKVPLFQFSVTGHFGTKDQFGPHPGTNKHIWLIITCIVIVIAATFNGLLCSRSY